MKTRLAPSRHHQSLQKSLANWRYMLQEQRRASRNLNHSNRELAEDSRKFVVYCEESMRFWSLSYNDYRVSPVFAA